MGIDYYIINKTKKEYVWLGRYNPVYFWHLLGKKITEEMLEYTKQAHIEFDIDECVFEPLILIDGNLSCDIIDNIQRHNIYTTLLKNYIKDCDCIALSDISDKVELDLDTDNMTNNIDVEDSLSFANPAYSMCKRCK